MAERALASFAARAASTRALFARLASSVIRVFLFFVFLFRKPKNNNARFCRNLRRSKMPDYNDSFHPPLEMLLRDLELKAATEKAITCAEIVELRSQIKKCFEQN